MPGPRISTTLTTISSSSDALTVIITGRPTLASARTSTPSPSAAIAAIVSQLLSPRSGSAIATGRTPALRATPSTIDPTMNHGTKRLMDHPATFLAMPNRAQVLLAKALLVALVTFVATEASLLVTLMGSAAILGDRPIGGQTPLDAGGLVFVLAMGLSTATFALIGLGLGAITRSGLATVVVLALVWYIVPLVAAHVPAPWNEVLSSLVPGALAGQLAATGNENSVFSALLAPWQAALVMLGYAVVSPALGAAALVRRDA